MYLCMLETCSNLHGLRVFTRLDWVLIAEIILNLGFSKLVATVYFQGVIWSSLNETSRKSKPLFYGWKLSNKYIVRIVYQELTIECQWYILPTEAKWNFYAYNCKEITNINVKNSLFNQRKKKKAVDSFIKNLEKFQTSVWRSRTTMWNSQAFVFRVIAENTQSTRNEIYFWERYLKITHHPHCSEDICIFDTCIIVFAARF